MRQLWRGAGRSHSEGRLSSSLLDEVDRGAEGGIAAAPGAGGGVRGQLDRPRAHPSLVGLPGHPEPAAGGNRPGAGSAMTTLATLAGDRLSALLDLPPAVQPMAVTPLGWPARPLGPPRRLPRPHAAHLDTYGQPFTRR